MAEFTYVVSTPVSVERLASFTDTIEVIPPAGSSVTGTARFVMSDFETDVIQLEAGDRYYFRVDKEQIIERPLVTNQTLQRLSSHLGTPDSLHISVDGGLFVDATGTSNLLTPPWPTREATTWGVPTTTTTVLVFSGLVESDGADGLVYTENSTEDSGWLLSVSDSYLEYKRPPLKDVLRFTFSSEQWVNKLSFELKNVPVTWTIWFLNPATGEMAQLRDEQGNDVGGLLVNVDTSKEFKHIEQVVPLFKAAVVEIHLERIP